MSRQPAGTQKPVKQDLTPSNFHGLTRQERERKNWLRIILVDLQRAKEYATTETWDKIPPIIEKIITSFERDNVITEKEARLLIQIGKFAQKIKTEMKELGLTTFSDSGVTVNEWADVTISTVCDIALSNGYNNKGMRSNIQTGASASSNTNVATSGPREISRIWAPTARAHSTGSGVGWTVLDVAV